jgi:acetylornithine deacetylase/succinyl-diaminopimelate desuccinylase-like protein
VSRRAAGLLLATFFFLAPLHCRKADGGTQDPVAREAEDALVAYLRIDTSNPPGNETAGAAFLRALLVKDGVPARLVGDDPKRQGVYARLASGSNEKALLLLSHIDVVPADARDWTQPPFGGIRSGGYLWGRGALDIKSLTIAQLMAVVDLKRRGAQLRRDVIFLAVPDEELGGVHGTRELLEKHPELFANVGYVLNEGGSNETAVDRVLFWGIEVQEKLPLWLRITATGAAGHGATPPEDGGSIARLLRALTNVEALEHPYRLDPSVARAMTQAADARTDARGKTLRLLTHEPLDVARIERELPAGYRNLLRDSVAITHLAAGSAINAVPRRAVAELDVRLLPDSTPEDMLTAIKNAIGKDAELEVLLSSDPVPDTPAGGELFDALSRAMHAAAPRSAVAPIVGAGTTDSRYFRARGIASYGVSPFKVNYYDADGVHGTDERIRGAFFGEGVGVFRDVIRDFCEKR